MITFFKVITILLLEFNTISILEYKMIAIIIINIF